VRINLVRTALYHRFMASLRIVFMGSPDFVIPILTSTLMIASELDGEVVAVYAAPDRPAGRGRKLLSSPVKEFAVAKGINVLSPARLTNDEEKARFADLGADLVVLAAYGLLLPAPFLFDPKHGAVNVHPSLLPRHRGASPVAGAILAGDTRTGATIMKMDEGLDTGDVLATRTVPLTGSERAPALTEALFVLGAEMLTDVLPAYVAHELTPTPQSADGVTIIKRFKKEDGRLDWTQPAVDLERRMRAFDPWPGTATAYRGERFEVLSGSVVDSDSEAPGTVVAVGRGVGVATGHGLLVLDQVKPTGRKPMAAADFVRGHPDFVGTTLPS
jgi:methionyl-tRNA formyltransferase